MLLTKLVQNAGAVFLLYKAHAMHMLQPGVCLPAYHQSELYQNR